MTHSETIPYYYVFCIPQVASYINVQGAMDTRTLSSSLTILENIVLNSQNKYAMVEKQITLPKLLQHISNNKVSK